MQMPIRPLSAKELFWSPYQYQLCYTPSTLSTQVKFQDIKNIVTLKQEKKKEYWLEVYVNDL